MQRVLMNTTNWLPASEVENYNPDHYSFEWNADFSQFRATKLRWHDDASYIAYQADCGDEE